MVSRQDVGTAVFHFKIQFLQSRSITDSGLSDSCDLEFLIEDQRRDRILAGGVHRPTIDHTIDCKTMTFQDEDATFAAVDPSATDDWRPNRLTLDKHLFALVTDGA